MATKAVCIWQECEGERTEAGDYPWIVSLDLLDVHGRAEATETLHVCVDRQEAMERGRAEAHSRDLPLYENVEGEPLTLLEPQQ